MASTSSSTSVPVYRRSGTSTRSPCRRTRTPAWPTSAALTPGSAIAIAHSSDDQPDPEIAEQVRAVRAAYARSATPVVMRSRAELRSALDGLELVGPGLVDITAWPDLSPEQHSWTYGAVGLVP